MGDGRAVGGGCESQQHQTGVRGRLKEYFVPGSMRPGERELVQKIDFFILTFCCLSYFLNYVSLLSFISFIPGLDTSLDFSQFPYCSCQGKDEADNGTFENDQVTHFRS